MKIIAFYLPQFHEIPENNQLWGQGFTEWTNVKNAKPLFEGHKQPVEPLDDNYYNLLDIDTMEWQCDLARNYGIYGFCFYHYWYNGHIIMNKPIENFLENKKLDISFCLCWANHDWTTSWADSEWKVIYKQDYSDKKEWDEHFYYMLPYFQDERYIKKDNKPLLVIYEAAGISCLNDLLDRWSNLALKEGFSGIDYAYQSALADTIWGFDDSHFSYDIEYQPQYVRRFKKINKKMILKHTLSDKIRKINDRTIKINLDKIARILRREELECHDYDEVWNDILRMTPISDKSIPGAFVRMDTTPRLKDKGYVTIGMNPQKFGKYLKKQIIRAREVYKSDMLFIFAWNEWAEGGYLEPDKHTGYEVLEAVKNALTSAGELP